MYTGIKTICVPVPEAIAEAVNVIVFIHKTNDGKKGRRVESVVELKGYKRGVGYCYGRTVSFSLT